MWKMRARGVGSRERERLTSVYESCAYVNAISPTPPTPKPMNAAPTALTIHGMPCLNQNTPSQLSEYLAPLQSKTLPKEKKREKGKKEKKQLTFATVNPNTQIPTDNPNPGNQ